MAGQRFRNLRWADLDRRCAVALHRWATKPWVLLSLLAASRLADGPVWYLLIIGLALLGGETGWSCALQMVACGALNLAIYRLLKLECRRERPYVDCPGIKAFERPLDCYSFPSGHTQHATAFAIILTGHYPELWPIAWGMVGLVAASRVVLGMHYPSDVLAGAFLGTTVAVVLLMLM